MNTKTVMIVESDPHLSRLMQRYTHSSGCRPVIAGLGEEALGLARQESPAVIVLEAELPGMTGWQVLRDLKEEPTTCDIPVLVCSWLDDERRCLIAGAAGHLRRPVLYGDFLAALTGVGVHTSVQTSSIK